MLRFLVGSTSWAGAMILLFQKLIWGEVIYRGWGVVSLVGLLLLVVFFLVMVEINLQARSYQALKEMAK